MFDGLVFPCAEEKRRRNTVLLASELISMSNKSMQSHTENQGGSKEGEQKQKGSCDEPLVNKHPDPTLPVVADTPIGHLDSFSSYRELQFLSELRRRDENSS